MKNSYPCFDCAKPIKIKKNEVVGGKMMVFEERVRFKCDECYKKNPHWEDNLQDCEVFSRIVGYMRPVSQWNPGKKEEYKGRKVFKVPLV